MRLILFLLKCLLGLFATIGFLIVVAFVGLMLGLKDAPWDREAVKIPDDTVLTLDLAGQVIETRPDNLLSRTSIGGMVVLRDTIAALERAQRDDRIKGLIVRFGVSQLGMAHAQELRDAILRFKASGRFAYAFAESFGELGNATINYYLASAADEIWLQPSGDLGAMGLILEAPFLRETLNLLGVEPRLAQREEYKGAMNTFTDSALPAPQRQNLQRLADSWMEQVVMAIAEGRKLPPAKVRQLIDEAPLSSTAAQEAGLLDGLGYWDQIVSQIDERNGSDPEQLPIRRYAAWLRKQPVAEGPKIAVIYGLGPIALADSQNDPVFGSMVLGAYTIADAISDAAEDEDVEAIVFRVDSPGGSYVASDTIHREVIRAREASKPVIVSMGNVAASGGYFVSMAADKIVAEPGTVTGSIGVVAGKFVLSGLWEKLGLNWDGVQSGANAGIWSQNRDFTPAQWNQLQQSLDRIYADFTEKVAEGRGLTEEQTMSAAKGQIWTGSDAKNLGLVDELGGFTRAVDLAKEAAGIEADQDVELRVFPPTRDPLEALIEDMLGEKLQSSAAASLVQWVARTVRLVDPLLDALESLGQDPRSRALTSPRLGPAG